MINPVTVGYCAINASYTVAQIGYNRYKHKIYQNKNIFN